MPAQPKSLVFIGFEQKKKKKKIDVQNTKETKMKLTCISVSQKRGSNNLYIKQT